MAMAPWASIILILTAVCSYSYSSLHFSCFKERFRFNRKNLLGTSGSAILKVPGGNSTKTPTPFSISRNTCDQLLLRLRHACALQVLETGQMPLPGCSLDELAASGRVRPGLASYPIIRTKSCFLVSSDAQHRGAGSQ
ncbi:hypothetical protein GGS20DRAFT_459728 [Poronia punctata]|nr:hypothetical protein GGS20DRAFT_459728 [Poronia punctata]